MYLLARIATFGMLAVAAVPVTAQKPATKIAAATASPGELLVDSFLPMPLGDRLLAALYQRMRASVATANPPNPPPPERVERAMAIMSAMITAEFHRLYPAYRRSQALDLDKAYSPAELSQLATVFADPRWPDLVVRGMLAIPLNYADDRLDPGATGPKAFLEEIRPRLGPEDEQFFAALTAIPAGQRLLAESKSRFDIVFKDAVDAGERRARGQLELLRDATRGPHSKGTK